MGLEITNGLGVISILPVERFRKQGELSAMWQ